MATLAPSLRNLRDEIDAVWPNRDRRTDGWIGDAAHQARQSDHNPDSRGIVHAIDVDKDGIDPDVVISQCVRDDRPTSYVVHNRLIWSRSRNWEPRPYTGTNPHTDHIHVSILYGTQWEASSWDWGIAGKTGARAQKPGPSDDMPDWDWAFTRTADSFATVGATFGQAGGVLRSLMGQ